jgi:hypothetical protein
LAKGFVEVAGVGTADVEADAEVDEADDCVVLAMLSLEVMVLETSV